MSKATGKKAAAKAREFLIELWNDGDWNHYEGGFTSVEDARAWLMDDENNAGEGEYRIVAVEWEGEVEVTETRKLID